MSVKATITRPSGEWPASDSPIWAMLSAPGAPVQQGDAGQDEERADRVGHREVERALERALLLDVVRHERVGGHAQELEEDEQVEQVAGEREADHRGQEHEHQRVVERPDHHEVAPREDERAQEQERGEQGQRGSDAVDRERDAERHAVRCGVQPPNQ